MTELTGRSISELKNLISSKKVSAVEVTEAHINQIQKYETQIDAFLFNDFDTARAEAAKVDALVAKGESLPLLGGIPVAIKDNMCASGTRTTCGSKILESFVSPYDGTAVAKLKSCGAVLIGKTNLDEFAMGSSTENSGFKTTKNPFNTDYVPGGSSGGSAAAVSAGFSVTSLGSDTGGSIRQPASFCGLVGMKPTYGTVSRFGLVAFASSLDQIGPFARNVQDCALTLLAISGHDGRDSTSLPDDYRLQNAKEPLTQALIEQIVTQSASQNLKGKRIGLIKELIGEGIDQDVREPILKACAKLEAEGAIVEEVSLPHARYALAVYYIVATAEASANLARFDGVRYGLRDSDAKELHAMYYATRQAGFGAEVKRRIMLGTYALSSGYYDAYYKKAQQVRHLITDDFAKIFANFDMVISPTAPQAVFKFGEKTEDPLKMYMSDIASIPANLAGLPGISIPCGFSQNGMPVGLQLVGPALSDGTILQVAQGLETILKVDCASPFIAKIKSN